MLSKLVEPEIKPQNEAIFNLRKEANKINEAITKMNETISDYEDKLERKEEQIWMMGSQINECSLHV